VARRILLVITDLEIGGTPTVVRELVLRLRSDDIVVEVACLKGWGPVADQLRGARVEVTAFGARRARELLGVAKRLRSLVRKRRIDTVFSFLVHANVVAAMAAKRLPGVRFLQSIQTVQPRPRWHWWAQRWAARWAERIVVPSTAIVRYASRKCGIPESKFVVIPNAIDADAFPRVEVFAGPKVRAGYLGRLDPAKDPGLLLASIEWAIAENADVELHYFGDGPERPRLAAAAERMGLGGHVYFHGTYARPQDALSQIDVLWHPSGVEGFGLVVIEAMASGVPVIALGAAGVLDIVENQRNGLLMDLMTCYRDMAGCLKWLRDDPGLRAKLIENGLKTVRERFTWERVLREYRGVLGF